MLCPVLSNVNLLGNGEGIVHIDAEILNSALYLGVTWVDARALPFRP